MAFMIFMYCSIAITQLFAHFPNNYVLYSISSRELFFLAITLYVMILAIINVLRERFLNKPHNQSKKQKNTRAEIIFFVIICFVIDAPLINKLRKISIYEPVIALNEEGIQIFNKDIISWDSIKSISKERRRGYRPYRNRIYLSITFYQGKTLKTLEISEDDMADSVPAVLEKIKHFKKTYE